MSDPSPKPEPDAHVRRLRELFMEDVWIQPKAIDDLLDVLVSLITY